LAIPHFGQLVGSYMKIMSRLFLCCQQAKEQRYRFAGYFVYRMAYYSVITAFLRFTGNIYISCGCSCNFFIGVWMLFYAVKLKLRTAKAAKALMLVSVGYITLLQLVYIIDKF
jgi:hypothetical protein